jgi:hypothetical protein
VTVPPRALSRWPKIQGESQLLLVRDVLIAEQQHGVFVHAGFDVPRLLIGEGLSQIDAGDLAEKMRMKLPDRHGHGAPPEEWFTPLASGWSAAFEAKLLPVIAKSTDREARRSWDCRPPRRFLLGDVAGRHGC